jgi:predicted nucleic acid-binding protein
MQQFNLKLSRMSGTRAYIDTNIFIYFFNKDPKYFALASNLLQKCADREILGTVSQLVVAEILVLPYREKNFEAIARIKTFFDQNNFLQVSEHRAGFMEESAMIAGEKNLKLMDAMHWHAAVSSQCEFFISNDIAFKSMGPIEVVHLSEFT